MNFEQARIDMIEQQLRTWDVLDAQILNLIRNLPREIFVPRGYQEFSYSDMQVPLTHEQVMLPPREVGRILQSLNVQPHEHVLEIGTGSGYLTALLSKLAEHVTSVEIFPDISDEAQKAWQHFQLTNIKAEIGDASSEWQPHSAFDVICITGALPQLADHWRRQLNIGGRLFVVLGSASLMHATLITRVSHQEWTNQILYETLVPTLINAQQPPEFEF